MVVIGLLHTTSARPAKIRLIDGLRLFGFLIVSFIVMGKPAQAKSQQAQSRQAHSQDVAVALSQGFEGNFATINNPLHIPVQVKFSSDMLLNSNQRVVVDAKSSARFQLKRILPSEGLSYQWIFGSPNITPSSTTMAPPFGGLKNHPITQAFGGKFSHSGEANYYAVDIQMPNGTPVVAAKAGIVFEVIDQFSDSGLRRDLVSKANAISILHEQGYYTVYAHLQQSSATVELGDIVEAGQLIAMSGDTGYVQGSHLHFAVLRNENFETVAIPFRFLNEDKLLKPKKGVWLSPAPANAPNIALPTE